MKRLLLITTIIAVITVWFPQTALTAVYAEPDYARDPEITADAAIVVDAGTGQALFEKDADTPMAEASLTKMMTALLTIENMEPEQVVTADKEAADTAPKGSNMALKEGEELTVEDMLYGLMLPSANDAAVALAKAMDGSVEKFAETMNAKAAALGMDNTNFVNPHGFDDDNHYTTARDMAVLAQVIMENKELRKIVGTAEYEIAETNKSEARKLKNTNKLFSSKEEISVYKEKRAIKFDGALGVKTGHTDNAGYCLAAAAERDGRELISIVLGAKKDLEYADTEELFEYGFRNFVMTKVIEKGQVMSEVTVSNGKLDRVKALSDSDVSALTSASDAGDEIKIEVRAEKSVNAPLKKGDDLGTAVVYYKDREVGSVKLTAAEEVKAAGIRSAFKSAGKIATVVIKIIIGIVAIFALWLIYSVIASAVRRRRRKNAKNFYGIPGYTSREVKRIRKLK
ncbi:MAG: D-alanyl-D-alanine carboxypeptidase [Clostridiales Family XIII bacterium]|jgi:D-alanyl-D-alanine carboxypeptidase (penicillin-binding protein 5/6)|nr:D-alanyl-D-alanine carboxypeptidase [Clostridiales Family XIII bacterium]